jgi:bromodomain-containing factor 1
MSTPVIRRNDSVFAGGDHPKREIHPPPLEDLWCNISKKSRVAKGNLNTEQLSFCSKLLSELHQNQHWTIVSPFYEPVGMSGLIFLTGTFSDHSHS